MKMLLSKCVRFCSRPLVRFFIGLACMLVPPVVAAGKGLLTLEPGFTYGVFYGFGLWMACDSLPSLFISRSRD